MEVLYTCATDSTSRRFYWCGQNWFIKHSPYERVGPGPSTFDYRNVEVGSDDSLKLFVRDLHDSKGWLTSSIRFSSAEIQTVVPLGYGLYQVDIHGPLTGPRWKHLVFGFFTYDLDDRKEEHKEIDIEIGTFDGKHWSGGVFSNQNDNDAMNIHPCKDSLAHRLSIKWKTDSITWTLINLENETVLDRYTTTSNIPQCDGASFIINLWQFKNVIPNGTEQSIVIRNFRFIPIEGASQPEVQFIDDIFFRDGDHDFVQGKTYKQKQISLKVKRRLTNVRLSIDVEQEKLKAEYFGEDEYASLNGGVEIKGGQTDFSTMKLTFFDPRLKSLSVRINCDQFESPVVYSLPINVSNK